VGSSTKYMKNTVGAQMTFTTGTTGKDHVVVTGTFTDGTTQVVMDTYV
jgi:hypothetical protein